MDAAGRQPAVQVAAQVSVLGADSTAGPAGKNAAGAPGAQSLQIPVTVTGAGAEAAAAAGAAVPSAGAAPPLQAAAQAPVPVAAAPAAPAPLATQLGGPLVALASAAPGDHVVTVNVSPDNLGPVTVRAHISGDQIRMELFAPSDAGRDALRSILGDLRRDLAGTGPGASLDLGTGNGPGSQAGSPSGSQTGSQQGPGQGALSNPPGNFAGGNGTSGRSTAQQAHDRAAGVAPPPGTDPNGDAAAPVRPAGNSALDVLA
ncbi:MAG TPA: flagellar hook-length control protein FliK [Micrococcaceae bacterium]